MPMYRYGYDGYGMMGGNWLGAAAMWVLWIAVVVAAIWLIVRLVRHDGYGHGPMMMHGMSPGGMAPPAPPAPVHDEAVAIARKRFAAGEITKEQYEEIVKTLE